VVRHPVRLLVQLSVAELAFPEYDGNGFAIAVDLKLDSSCVQTCGKSACVSFAHFGDGERRFHSMVSARFV
jgi:hypothetical protein